MPCKSVQRVRQARPVSNATCERERSLEVHESIVTFVQLVRSITPHQQSIYRALVVADLARDGQALFGMHRIFTKMAEEVGQLAGRVQRSASFGGRGLCGGTGQRRRRQSVAQLEHSTRE